MSAAAAKKSTNRKPLTGRSQRSSEQAARDQFVEGFDPDALQDESAPGETAKKRTIPARPSAPPKLRSVVEGRGDVSRRVISVPRQDVGGERLVELGVSIEVQLLDALDRLVAEVKLNEQQTVAKATLIVACLYLGMDTVEIGSGGDLVLGEWAGEWLDRARERRVRMRSRGENYVRLYGEEKPESTTTTVRMLPEEARRLEVLLSQLKLAWLKDAPKRTDLVCEGLHMAMAAYYADDAEDPDLHAIGQGWVQRAAELSERNHDRSYLYER